VGSVAKAYGWRWGMWAPGLIGLAMALLVGAAVADSPQAAGYPPVEQPARVEAEVGGLVVWAAVTGEGRRGGGEDSR
jgi:sugar phosphate permease